MKKVAILFTLLLLGSSASALPIISIITGADMAGMVVTANFADGTSETGTWTVLSQPATPVPPGSPLSAYEGFSGGVVGNGWSLTQQGETFGDVDLANNIFFGQWTLANDTGVAITDVVIGALAGGIVFDNVFGVEETPNSDVGRPFTPNAADVVGTYGNPFSSPDLWGRLTLEFNSGFDSGRTLNFMADTDKLPVPGTLLLMLAWPLSRIARKMLLGGSPKIAV